MEGCTEQDTLLRGPRAPQGRDAVFGAAAHAGWAPTLGSQQRPRLPDTLKSFFYSIYIFPPYENTLISLLQRAPPEFSVPAWTAQAVFTEQ